MEETKTETKETKSEATAESEMVHAARTWAASVREAGKVVADTAIAMQDRNVHFAQYVTDQGLKQLEDQTVALRQVYGTMSSQADARRAAFRDLGREAADAYIGFLATPVKLARRAVASVREYTEREYTERDAGRHE
jgi:hypothetical protein